MKSKISVNTVFKKLTRIPNGCDLIYNAYSDYKGISTENWPYPYMTFGDPRADDYYAEIWTAGMDWQTDYWLIESKDLSKPIAYPLLSFYEYKPFSDVDDLLRACMWLRKHNEKGYFSDSIWPYIHRTKEIDDNFIEVEFEHASQKPIRFKMLRQLTKTHTVGVKSERTSGSFSLESAVERNKEQLS